MDTLMEAGKIALVVALYVAWHRADRARREAESECYIRGETIKNLRADLCATIDREAKLSS